ncbi:hypothetical protein J6590_052410 [Homalodisca vitripennis]|nr:hypothetical protein J6590_052410 [Homalodisca vitripennis]
MVLYVICILLIIGLYETEFTACLLCRDCISGRSSQQFQGDILSIVATIPTSTVCIWSNRREDHIDFDLLKRLSNKNKAVVSTKTLPVENLPEVCEQNVILSERDDCHQLLSPTLPLSVFHNFYALAEEDWSRKMAQCSVQFGPARVVFVLLRDSSIFSLSSPFYLPRHFTSADSMNIMEPEDLRPSSFNGMFLNIATFNCTPFVIFDKNNAQESISGIEWEIVKLLSNTLNFKIRLTELEGDGRWGARINGTISGGILKALAERKADIGVCNLWNVIGRYDIVDFGPSNNEPLLTPILSLHLTHTLSMFRSIIEHVDYIQDVDSDVFGPQTIAASTCLGNVDTNVVGNICSDPAKNILPVFGMLMLTSSVYIRSTNRNSQLVTYLCMFRSSREYIVDICGINADVVGSQNVQQQSSREYVDNVWDLDADVVGKSEPPTAVPASPVESMLAMFGILTLTSWAVRTSNSSGRQLVTCWCVFVMMLTATYSSSIAARLTLPKYETRIDTVQQLVEQGFNWYDEEYTEHDKRNVYLNSDNYWQRELDQHFVSLAIDGILPALRSRKFAFPVQRWDSFFIYFDGDKLKYKEGLHEMRVLKETISAFYVSLAFAKRSPFLHALQVPLLHIYEAGFTTYWTQKIVRTRMDDYAKTLLEEHDVGDVHQLKMLSLTNLKPVFYILISGLLLSAVLFISELMYSYHWY